MGALYEAVKLKAALTEVRRLSQRVNQYLNERAPWTLIKEDPAAAATAVYVALQAIDWLKLLWAPILPHSSEQLHQMLGYDRPHLRAPVYASGRRCARVASGPAVRPQRCCRPLGSRRTLPAGQAMREPAALFVKLDDEPWQRSWRRWD